METLPLSKGSLSLASEVVAYRDRESVALRFRKQHQRRPNLRAAKCSSSAQGNDIVNEALHLE